jgi:hypothetical protein
LWLVDAFYPRAVIADVVSGPAEPEVVAAGDEFADEFGECLVEGVLSCVGAQGGEDLGAVDVCLASTFGRFPWLSELGSIG